jgi:hypothetical protein
VTAIGRVLWVPQAVEQQDAADEVRASRWRPSQLILVLGRLSGVR